MTPQTPAAAAVTAPPAPHPTRAGTTDDVGRDGSAAGAGAPVRDVPGQRSPEQRPFERRGAERRAPERRAPEQRSADQRAPERGAPEQPSADQRPTGDATRRSRGDLLDGARSFLRRPTCRQAVTGGVAAVLVVGGLVAGLVVTAPPAPQEVTLSEALAVLADGGVTAATVDDLTTSVTLTLEAGDELRAVYPAAFGDEITQQLLDEGVELTAETGARSVGADLLLRLGPVLLIVGVLLVVLRVANPTAFSRGRSSGAKPLASGEVPQVTFADVAGADEAVAQLQEMVQFLREPERFEALGATRPRGALLVGPPGTGKTLLARAVAGEAEVPFFALAGSDFIETYVGVGARRVRDLFAEARKAERAIIFIDEIDAVGRARGGAGGNGGDGERENTLISLLNEMDGFAGSQVIVLAATNRADTLDAALTRPGRLDRQVQVPNPDRRGRTLILEVHGRSRPLADDVDLVQVARQTPGMSGADLAQVVNEACMEAARRGQPLVDAACFQAAIESVALGRARTSALITEFDREVTAWHEAGHTLAAALLPDADDPVSVTIVPRGPAGGVTWMSGNDDIFLPRKKALAQLVVALAGRAAEERLLDGEHTQGASSDLHGATNLATAMVTQYGMTDFGYAQVDADTLRVGGQVAARAHESIEALLRDAHRQATALLEEHGGLLEALALALLAEETLPGTRIAELVAEHGLRAA